MVPHVLICSVIRSQRFQLDAEQLMAEPYADESPWAAACPAAALSAWALHASVRLAFAAWAYKPHERGGEPK